MKLVRWMLLKYLKTKYRYLKNRKLNLKIIRNHYFFVRKYLRKKNFIRKKYLEKILLYLIS
jgi:hypothetical protein